MENELIIKKCKSCGALVQVLKDCTCDNCGIKCCGTEMERLIPNSVDAAAEKHVPTYDILNGEIMVRVNHPMEEEHYIEWITLVKDNRKYTVNLYPGQEPECKFEYMPGSTLYAYCNKHELWKKEVE